MTESRSATGSASDEAPVVRTAFRLGAAGLRFVPGGIGAHGRAILNGLNGHRLAEEDHHIAIETCFRHERRVLVPTASEILKAQPDPTRTVAVFVHGLFLTEESWRFRDDPSVSYGTLLQRELGVTPLYVRYNTGRSVEVNAQGLVALLDTLWSAYPVPIESIVLVGHSMGGLVLRMAAHHATIEGHAWSDSVRTMIYLGAPHTGSWVAQSTHHLSSRAAEAPRWMPLTRGLGRATLHRSDAIKDLRRGIDTPLLAHADHYGAGASITRGRANPIGWVLGDLLVGQHSAAGRTVTGRPTMDIPPENFRRFRLSHFSLAHSPSVFEQIREWIVRSQATSPTKRQLPASRA